MELIVELMVVIRIFLLNFLKEIFIDRKLFAGFISVLVFTSCASLRESLILGAGTGAVVGGVTGGQVNGNKSENAIAGAVIGGVVGGLASYIIHGSLESRDARVRKDTLLNLEKYDVLGRDGVAGTVGNDSPKGDKCYTTREVDGRLVSIPCRYVDDPNYPEATKQ
jgi:uncharacterized membrane protein